MGKDQILEQLVAVTAEMQELCAVLRQNTVLTKNTGLLLKRHTVRMHALLCEHGIEKLPDVIEENALLVEQNLILVEQRENDVQSLVRLQEKLDAIQAGRESSATRGAKAV